MLVAPNIVEFEPKGRGESGERVGAVRPGPEPFAGLHPSN